MIRYTGITVNARGPDSALLFTARGDSTGVYFMGLDGGTVATRSDLLRRSSWRLANSDDGARRSTRGGQLCVDDALASSGVERFSRQAEIADAFSLCALSGAAFPPTPKPGSIVADAIGNLLLRDAVIEFLSKSGQFRPGMCDTAALEATFGHIERLRSVFAVTLAPNPSLARSGSSHDTSRAGMWRCPISEASTNGSSGAFVALRPCGHVLRERVAVECASSAARPTSAASVSSASMDDGISAVQGGRWDCPCCGAPCEVLVRLVPAPHIAERVRLALHVERDARRVRKAEKRKRGESMEVTAGGAEAATPHAHVQTTDKPQASEGASGCETTHTPAQGPEEHAGR